MPSGSAASKKKKWYLADSMSFLNAFIGQHRKSTGNAITENIIEDDIRSPEDSGNDASLVEDISLDITVPSPANPHHTHVKKIRMTPVDLVAGPMIELLKSQTDQWPEPVRPIMKFFESLVPDVEKLSSRRQRLFKERVLHILHNYLDEEENEAPLNSRCSTCSSSSPQPILM